jgi:hypothetical protein
MIWLPPSSDPDGVWPHWFDITHHWPFSSARAGYSVSHQLSASASYALACTTTRAPARRSALAVSAKSPSKHTGSPSGPKSSVGQTVSRGPAAKTRSSPSGAYRCALRCTPRSCPSRPNKTAVLYTSAPPRARSGTLPAASHAPAAAAAPASAAVRGPSSGSALAATSPASEIGL